MAEPKQYLYILSNNERPELIKIGRTDRHPVLRAEQLSKQTGVLGTYIVEWFLEVPNSVMAEKLVHYKMKEYHYDKEFFKTSVEEAIKVIEQTLFPFFQITETSKVTEQDIKDSIAGISLLLDTEDEVEKQEILNEIHKLEAQLFRLKYKNK
jgi:hypothetical protein